MTSGAAKGPKKANLLDPHAIKHVLDESVNEIVTGKGYGEDFRLSNVRLLIGTVIIGIALLAQFHNKKFPENRNFLITCIISYPFFYVILNGILQFISYTKEKNAILFTYPPAGSFNSTGLTVSSKLPRFSDMYTLTVASADPKSISANKTVEFTKSVTKVDKSLVYVVLASFVMISLSDALFTKDGILVEGLFWKDVERLIDDYNDDRKSK
ncbi:LOW QUALITY PROTEIN: probable signal peptidase complex subunit 2 [Dioscorea cayenensis subsp. rotundata]|uniref:Signal peptidase complex subunit 2 n=1 Tax=Dioscorea cayennensis subsp. rotundata TaxID=55577 RepID=A0AB40BJJ5_DIOCR|nr:LOW QUALITY PROTEIN: probable signal peptidase complex subunit 2 [Dioscorea cayenensis subsp. rotundata]